MRQSNLQMAAFFDMEETFIGRQKERKILREALDSREAEMVAVIGRRRVGKTALIKHVYKERMVFEITGLQNAPLREQLDNFAYAIKKTSGSRLPIAAPENWLRAFMLLIEYLETLDFTEKKVVFIDELSWMATRKSGFIRALGFFWNSWAVNQNIVVVICGSAASWMIENVVNDRGGLHNRITKQILLKPFTLLETEQYFQNRHIYFNRYQIVQIYMAMGGVPHYLKEVRGEKSAMQNIDDICFSGEGILKKEFSRLYPSLFDQAERHIAIIRALATAHQGLPRTQILSMSKLPDNGNTTRIIEELVESGFVTGYFPFGKIKKDMLYRLTDEYSLFYLQFIEPHINEASGTWHQLSQKQTYKTWSGYAFESLCLKHLHAIKLAMSIAGIYSVSSTFYKKGTADEAGAQIDLVLDRADQVINVFEIKFNTEEMSLTKTYAEDLSRKINVLRRVTKTGKQISLVLISALGLKHNQHSLGLVQQVLTLDDLFRE